MIKHVFAKEFSLQMRLQSGVTSLSCLYPPGPPATDPLPSAIAIFLKTLFAHTAYMCTCPILTKVRLGHTYCIA